MIKGITHTEDGQQIQRLAVSTKVAIGLPPNPAEGKKAHPTKLDHFIFLMKSPTEQNKWEIDPKLTKAYGQKCKEFEIVLLDDEIENVFPTKLAWFTASECRCFGDGESATRRTAEHPEGQPWTPCGKACPDLERGDCKPAADLRFMLAAFPQLGAVARIHTSSYRSIMQISSSLQQIQLITGGRLAGIRAKLVVRPEKTSYMGADQKRHSTTVYALNLEIQAAGIRELVTHMTDHARLFEHTRKLLGTGRIEVIEDDSARAGEITPEFYPEVSPPKFPTAEEAGQAEPEIIPPQKQPNMDVMCQECRQVNGHKPDCFYATQQPATSDRSTKCVSCNAPPGKPHATGCPEKSIVKVGVKDGAVASVTITSAANPIIRATQEAIQPQTAAAPSSDTQTANGAPTGLQTMLLQVLSVEAKEKPIKKNGKPTGEKQQYRVLTVLDLESLQWSLYAWDTKHFEFLDPIPAKTNCIFQVKRSETANGNYYSIEHIVETGGLRFRDDKPVIEGQVVEAEDEDMSLFDEAATDGE
jgi:hypothetical protein